MMQHTRGARNEVPRPQKTALVVDKGGGAQLLFEVVLKMLTDIGSAQAAQGL
jgi:hypothetical protein